MTDAPKKRERRPRSTNMRLLAFWESLTEPQQDRALKVLAAMMGYEVTRPTLPAKKFAGVEDTGSGWDLPSA